MIPDWLNDSALQQFFAATSAAGGTARVVGGAVRDHVLGLPVREVDIASSLAPEATMNIALQHGWKSIPTGILHGTVTLVLPTRTVEVTTLRRDVETDGRHARIVYTDSFAEDAARRDFTMNALFMDAAGVITDYYHGQADIATRTVRFIGDPAQRIREDALRMLRYFRFIATHGNAAVVDEAMIGVMRTHRVLLDGLSGERIASEMRKLLSAHDPSAALWGMYHSGFDVALCGHRWQMEMLPRLLLLESQHFASLDDCPMRPWVRLLTLLSPAVWGDAMAWLTARYKLSRADQKRLRFLSEEVAGIVMPSAIKQALRYQPREWVLAKLLLAAVLQPTEGLAELTQLATGWQPISFPVRAADVMAQGMPPGAKLGAVLDRLEALWVASDYQLSNSELLDIYLRQA